MLQAYKRRPSDFKRRVLSKIKTSRKDLLVEENRWLKMMKKEELKGVRYYNLHNHEFNHWACNQNHLTTIEKISDARGKQVFSEESRKKRAESIKRAWADGRMKGMTGKTHSDEYKAILSKRHSGVQLTGKHLANIRDAASRRKGVPTGKSHINQRNAVSNKLKEMWKDPSYREKMSAMSRVVNIGRPSPVSGTYWWTDGVKNVRRKDSPGENWVRGRAK